MRLTTVLSLALLSLTVACGDTAQGMKKDANDAAQTAKKVGEETREVAREVKDVAKDVAVNTTEKVVEGAVNATEKVAEGAAQVVERADATAQAVDVKASLMADTTIDSSRIRVESDNASRTIFLRGQVTTPDQSAASERVARIKAAGYNVKNELVVAPK